MVHGPIRQQHTVSWQSERPVPSWCSQQQWVHQLLLVTKSTGCSLVSVCSASQMRCAACSKPHFVACSSSPATYALPCPLCRGGQLQRVHHVLNETLVDRGASPAMVVLECFVDGRHLTTVQASCLGGVG